MRKIIKKTEASRCPFVHWARCRAFRMPGGSRKRLRHGGGSVCFPGKLFPIRLPIRRSLPNWKRRKTPEPLPSKKDDYFEAVNGALLSDWEIAADESYVSQISKMQDRTNEQMASVLQTAAKNEASEKGSDENNIRALYLTGMDQEGRNAGGYGQLLTEYFESIDSAENINELMRVCLRFDRGLWPLLDRRPDLWDGIWRIPLKKSCFWRQGIPDFPRKSGFLRIPPIKASFSIFMSF